MVHGGSALPLSRRPEFRQVMRVRHFPEGGIAPGMCQTRVAQPIKGLPPIGHTAVEAQPPDAELPGMHVGFLPLRGDQSAWGATILNTQHIEAPMPIGFGW